MNITKGRVIGDIIEQNKRQFIIPVYQRNYEWYEKHCEKLFDDIVNAANKDKRHFVGSIVYANMSEDRIRSYAIIDGQQRITTIFILLQALYSKADNELVKQKIHRWLFNYDEYTPVLPDSVSKLKLKPIRSDNEQLTKLINNELDDIDKTSNIYINYELFNKLIDKALSDGVSIDNILHGIELLECALIILEGEDDPQEVFESINSTGLELYLSDLIRNFSLMTDINQQDLFDNYWIKIEELVGRDKMNDYFIDYLNFKCEGFIKEKDAYDSFKNLFYKGKYNHESMLSELKKYAKYYNYFYGNNSDLSVLSNKYLRGLIELKQTTSYPFLFKVFDDYTDGIFEQCELEKILKFIVNYSVRRIVCEVGSNSLRGLYKTLYNRIFDKKENKEHYYDSIVSFLMQLTTKDAIPSDENFRKSLKEKDLYHKNKACKYVLDSIENSNNKEYVVGERITIEHIMPQNDNLSDDWKKMLGDNWEEIHTKYLHTLGNLTLTGFNSELSDNNFADKKKKLTDYSSKMVELYKDVIDKEEWNENTIVNRTERLANQVIDIFAIELPTNKIEFKDKEFKEYTCENNANATGKAPNYFVIEGNKENISSFKEMLDKTISYLYEKDPSIIKKLATTNGKIIENSDRVWISYNEKEMSSSEQINNTGIFYRSGLSARNIVLFIKGLLDEYSIDLDDFVYSAKVNDISSDEE